MEGGKDVGLEGKGRWSDGEEKEGMSTLTTIGGEGGRDELTFFRELLLCRSILDKSELRHRIPGSRLYQRDS